MYNQTFYCLPDVIFYNIPHMLLNLPNILGIHTVAYRHISTNTGLPLHLVQTFMFPRGWSLITLMIPWLFLWCLHSVLCEMSQQFLYGLPWNLVETVMPLSGWTVTTATTNNHQGQNFNVSNTLFYDQIVAKMYDILNILSFTLCPS